MYFRDALIYNFCVKIYTKTGDSGTTSLFGGKRVEKFSKRIEACGNVDELNSLLGVVISSLEPSLRATISSARSNPNKKIATSSKTLLAMTPEYSSLTKKLARVQAELFVLGGDLATPPNVRVKIPRISKLFIVRLEKEIDIFENKLPKLKNFILPGGGRAGSKLHLARSIARRAERKIVELSSTEKINKFDLIYINRLSDWFFVMARHANKLDDVQEIVWKGRGK